MAAVCRYHLKVKIWRKQNAIHDGLLCKPEVATSMLLVRVSSPVAAYVLFKRDRALVRTLCLASSLVHVGLGLEGGRLNTDLSPREWALLSTSTAVGA